MLSLGSVVGKGVVGALIGRAVALGNGNIGAAFNLRGLVVAVTVTSGNVVPLVVTVVLVFFFDVAIYYIVKLFLDNNAGILVDKSCAVLYKSIPDVFTDI